MALRGDFAGLKRFAGQVDSLSEMRRLVALGAVSELEKLVLSEFGGAEDPYGQPWEPLKAGGPPLQSLADEVEVTAFGEGSIRAEALFPAVFHQTGTRRVSTKSASKQITKLVKRGFIEKPSTKSRREMAEQISGASGMHSPARPIVPVDGRGLPSTWERVLEETAQRIFDGTIREAR